jgi:hypothetical protein
MTSFLVYHKEAIRFSFQRNSADEAPLSGCNEAARLLRRPLITRTKPDRCESAIGGVS